MPDEKRESRITVEDLEKAEQELAREEAEEVKGGISGFGFGSSGKNSPQKEPAST